jgi:hypothetical protein
VLSQLGDEIQRRQQREVLLEVGIVLGMECDLAVRVLEGDLEVFGEQECTLL